MTIWKRVSGDINDYILVKGAGVSDMSAVTAVRAIVWKSGVQAVALTGSVVDPDNNIWRIDLSPWLDDASKGKWKLRSHLKFAGDTEYSWPEGEPDEIDVSAA